MGSMISLISMIIFLYLIYKQLTDKIPAKGKINRQYFNNILNNKNILISNLEWVLPNPPKFHHFSQLPVL